MKKSSTGVIRILEICVESMGWIQIMASPTIIGLIIALIIYYSHPSTLNLIIGIVVVTLGTLIGILWATKRWHGKGTIWFLSRSMAKPVLDGMVDESNKR